MATEFACEAGKVLSRTEAADMLLYDEAGVARPEEYADVVFDATGIRGAVYRCKTEAEKSTGNAAAQAAAGVAENRAKRIAEIQHEAHVKMAGRDDIASEPVNTGGVRLMDAGSDAGQSTDEAEQTASGDAKSDGGKPASRKTS